MKLFTLLILSLVTQLTFSSEINQFEKRELHNIERLGKEIIQEREGGGGNVIAAEFVIYGKKALSLLTRVDDRITYKAIEDILATTEVFNVKSICYSDQMTGEELCLDARYNDQKRVIQFNSAKWNNISCKQKLTLTSHEYLRALGIERADYSLSSRFLTGDFFTGDNERTLNKNDSLYREMVAWCRDIENI